MLADRTEAKQPEGRTDGREVRRRAARPAPVSAAEGRVRSADRRETLLIDEALAQRLTRLASMAVAIHIGEATARRRQGAAPARSAKEQPQ